MRMPWRCLNLALLAGLLALPAPWIGIFDGLPLAGRTEALVAALGLPLLLLAEGEFLRRRGVSWLLLGLFFLRLWGMAAAPCEGLSLRAYPGEAAFRQGRWERGWSSLWHPEASGLMRGALTSWRELPLEWLNRYPPRARKELTVVISLRGWVRVPPGTTLALLARGVSRARLRAGDTAVPLVASPEEALHLPPPRGGGTVVPLRGTLRFRPLQAGGPWCLQVLLVRPGRWVKDAFAAQALWCSPAGARLGPGMRWALRAAGRAADYGLCLLLALWAAAAGRSLWRRGALDGWVLACAALGVGAQLAFRLIPGQSVYAASRGTALACLLLLAVAAWRRPPGWRRHPGWVIWLAAAPAVFSYFLVSWWNLAPRLDLYHPGDDWFTYQAYARAIVLDRDWLLARHCPVLVYQPLYRYLVALLHLVFGPSTLAQRLLDVWSLTATAAILAGLVRRWGLSLVWRLTAPALYLYHMLADRFILLVGLGLQEYAALLPLMLAARSLNAAGEGSAGRGFPWAAGVWGVVAVWLRLDHTPGAAALFLFALPPLRGGVVRAYRGLLSGLGSRAGAAAGYVCLLAGGVLLVALRNWWCGGQFTLVAGSNLSHLQVGGLAQAWHSVRLLLDANDRLTGLAGRLIWAGVIAGMLGLVLRVGILRRYPLELGLILLALVLPYLVVQVNAYTPRFSIHLLPFAVLSVVVLAEAVWGKLAGADGNGGKHS